MSTCHLPESYELMWCELTYSHSMDRDEDMLSLDTSNPKLVYCSCMAGDLRIASHGQVQADITPSIVGCDCRAGLSIVDRIVDLHHLDNHKRAESPCGTNPC